MAVSRPLLRIFTLLLVQYLLAGPTLAVTSNWIGPGSDFNTTGNWDAGIPNDVAGFNSASPTSISLSLNISLNSLTFNPGASAYTLNVQGIGPLILNGAGIVNNSSNIQTIKNLGANIDGTVFHNSATAGNANIIADLGGSVTFTDSSSAGNATITNNQTSLFCANCFGGTRFNNNSTAGNSTIANNSNVAPTYFNDTSTGGGATITNNFGGVTAFQFNSTAGH